MESWIRTVIPSLLLTTFLIENVFGQDQKGAVWTSSAHAATVRNGHKVKWIILHGTAGRSGARVGNLFKNDEEKASKASAHYTIDRAGLIVQSVREKYAVFANGKLEEGHDGWWSKIENPNEVTIAIELVKTKADNSDKITQAQKSASFRLIRDIIRRHPGIRKGWANANGGITGHYSLSPESRKNCPGPYPWKELFAFLGGASHGHGSDAAGTRSHHNGGVRSHSGSASSNAKCTATVTAENGLRVRAEPNTDSETIDQLTDGQKVVVRGKVTGQNIEGNTAWFKVGKGYSSGKFLHVKGGASWCHQKEE